MMKTSKKPPGGHAPPCRLRWMDMARESSFTRKTSTKPASGFSSLAGRAATTPVSPMDLLGMRDFRDPPASWGGSAFPRFTARPNRSPAVKALETFIKPSDFAFGSDSSRPICDGRLINTLKRTSCRPPLTGLLHMSLVPAPRTDSCILVSCLFNSLPPRRFLAYTCNCSSFVNGALRLDRGERIWSLCRLGDVTSCPSSSSSLSEISPSSAPGTNISALRPSSASFPRISGAELRFSL
mmetsp:Transcript_47210/g.85024  ORF Transcript_47210/g.85024 Transcript_47210/m.85024 type:complete len:239 (-) Transcript_47210:1198-1914(-)